MVWRKVAIVAVTAVFELCQSAWTQTPTYGVGRTPTPEEIRAWDIAISPTGKELPQGRVGQEGAALFVRKGCGCHGRRSGRDPERMPRRWSPAKAVNRPRADDVPCAVRERLKTRWRFTHRSRRLSGTTSTAACLWGKKARSPPTRCMRSRLTFCTKQCRQEDDVLDADSLPKVKMPNRDGFALPPAWKHGSPRLQGYP